MATTSAGTPYVTGSDNITGYPTTSLALANRVDAVEQTALDASSQIINGFFLIGA
jgi:hypothetical protein